MVVAAGCGLGERQERADAVIDGTRSLLDAAVSEGPPPVVSGTGTLRLAVEIASVPGGFGDLSGTGGAVLPVRIGGDPADGDRQASVTLPAVEHPVVIDFAGRRAAILRDGEPWVLYDLSGDDRFVIYGRRHNAVPGDARPWAKLDLVALVDENRTSGRLDPREVPPPAAAVAIGPLLTVALAAGPLAGSMEVPVADTVAGTPATRYEGNFDIEKVLTDTLRRHVRDEDRRDAVKEVFDVLGVSGTVHPGRAWLDGTGRLRAFAVDLDAEPFRRLELVLHLSIELDGLSDGPAGIGEMPGDDAVIEVETLPALLRAVIPPPGEPAEPGEPGAAGDGQQDAGDGTDRQPEGQQ